VKKAPLILRTILSDALGAPNASLGLFLESLRRLLNRPLLRNAILSQPAG
jgi:hypothetical protein